MTYRGHVEKGSVVVDEPLPLPDGTPVVVERVPTAPGEFWQSYTLEELALRQGVSAPTTFDDLLGGWPVEERNDNFEETYLHWRQGELENRQ